MAIGKIIIVIGIIFIILGLTVLYVPKVFNWFGNLPGDIRIEKENTRVFIPITTMIVISIILTILFNLAGWFISRWK